eukprot:m.57444 g.57444  ORF g.57444 m.57444 type:complete len:151 (+) comp15606_c0_seq8:135-587(+)
MLEPNEENCVKAPVPVHARCNAESCIAAARVYLHHPLLWYVGHCQCHNKSSSRQLRIQRSVCVTGCHHGIVLTEALTMLFCHNSAVPSVAAPSSSDSQPPPKRPGARLPSVRKLSAAEFAMPEAERQRNNANVDETNARMADLSFDFSFK